MNEADDFSTYHEDLLDGQYDCVDRIVLNGYFALGQQGGGFRTWWRCLKEPQWTPKAGRDPADTGSRASQWYRRASASAIWLLAALPVQRKRTFIFDGFIDATSAIRTAIHSPIDSRRKWLRARKPHG
jgi:hypothetical protein